MNPTTMPKVIGLGFGEVVEVKYLEKLFGISRRTAFKILRSLRIEPIYVGADAFFSLMCFKRIMFVLSKPNGPGFVFSGSKKKYDQRIYKEGAPQITQITDELLAEAADPKILKEMAICDAPGNANMLRAFFQKPKQEKEPPQGETP